MQILIKRYEMLETASRIKINNIKKMKNKIKTSTSNLQSFKQLT